MPWWKRGVGGAAGNAMVGLDQKMFRDQPPADQVVELHSRLPTTLTLDDGSRLIVTVPEAPGQFRPEDTRATYDAVARHYADEIAGELANKPFDRDFLDRLAAGVGDGGIVELGCGPGHVSGYLASRGATVSGLDLAPLMVAQAQRLFRGLTFEVGDMLNLPFDDAALSAVVSFYSIVHFDETQTERAFREMARVLAPGGRAALAFHVGTDVIHRDEWFGERVAVDFSFHDPAVVVRQLESVGFAIDELTERDPYPPPVEFQSRRCYIVATRQ